MRSRCRNKCRHNYAMYGGRGIIVCERWDSYEAFLADMGRCPEGHTLDRIDPNGNYEPSNCRWATYINQLNNKRTNRRVEFHGETKTLAEWERAIGLNKGVLKGRLRIGWSIERALTTLGH